MTDWRAVGYGFLAGIVTSALGIFLPVVGHGIAGLVAGFVAGYLAGGGPFRGAWYGLLAGAIGGVALSLLTGLFALVGLSVFSPVLGVVGGFGIFTVAAIGAVLFAFDSALAGAIGGILGPEND